MELEEALKNALQARVRSVNGDSTLVLDFNTGSLSQHVASNDQAQAVVIDATDSAADQFNRVLNNKGLQRIRGSISRQTGYGAAIVVMRGAVVNGSDPKEKIG